MIAANDDFIRSVQEAIDKVAELEAMLSQLHDRELIIRVRYVSEGMPGDIAAGERIVRTQYINTPPPPVPGGTERVTESFGDLKSQIADIDAETQALRASAEAMRAAEEEAYALNDAMNAYGTVSERATGAQRALITGILDEKIAAGDLGNAVEAVLSKMGLLGQVTAGEAAAGRQLAAETNAIADALDAGLVRALDDVQSGMDKSVFETTRMMNAFRSLAAANKDLDAIDEGMKRMTAGLAAIPIAGGLAAFGITSLGTAIHLVVMGTAEFLAVFLPAMYAAAAGAYVMMQGIQNVTTHINSMYTATESLGPMMNTTAGDMLGLGHSIQTAQNMANPGVYELLGLAIGGIAAYSGTATLGLNGLKQTAAGAAGGLTSFGQVGLDVTHMLDAFGAKVVTDLQGPLGATLHSLVASATNDLRTFGQILGNLGHAIVSLAAAMPGLAEVLLHVIDGITALVKWFSQLPPALLTAIFVIEEMYRWSGLLAGAFGLVGRGIALLGTLGIPVFAAIGRNVATMAANVIAGVSNMVANFGQGLSKMGVIGEEGVQGIARFRNVLGGAVTFLEGPWGIAFGLGVVAVGALIFALSRMKDATQQWIAAATQAVAKASNLQVLNVIGQQMADTSKKISSAWQEWNDSAKMLGGTFSQAADAAIKLTGYQKQLSDQALNVVKGAIQISGAYGVSFVTALGLADMAGVKLASSIGKNGQLTAQAALQIGALVLGYEKMNQTGGILQNSMAAVNVQAGLQASKVQQLNTAWDQFIAMGTSLTGGWAQLNLDMQQMGNIAPAVGGKIRAFSGQVGMSVSQIAQSLNSFSGTSAQVWQSYNQSVQQANTFTDALRTASAAGVVTQKQYTEGVASTVAQLLPYASSSKAALAELMAIAQEAAGPAYDSTKSLTQNYQALKDWTDKFGLSSQQAGSLVSTLTQAITNVTKVAANFAGTLQSDVLNAIAQAAVGTANITQLTQRYTQALQSNFPQSNAVTSAQNAFDAALKRLGFSTTDIAQLNRELTTAYGQNQAAATRTTTATNITKTAFDKLAAQFGITRSQADNLWNNVGGRGKTAFDILQSNSDLSRTKFERLASQLGITKGDADKLWASLQKIKPITATIHENGFGQYTITGSVIAASQGKGGSGNAAGGLATGGRIAGYGGGDIVPAMLEPGEAVVPKHLVSAVAPFLGANKVPGFATGGLVSRYADGFTGLGNWADNEHAQFFRIMTAAMETAMTGATRTAQAAAQKAANAMIQASSLGAGPGGSVENVLRSLAAARGWTGSQWVALNNVEMREAGYSLTAQNPGSGAYGIAQFINGPSEYYQYGGNPNTAVGQATAMLNYIAQRYGSPAAAWAHELAFGWYDQGGFLPPGLSLAMNNTGVPEVVTPPPTVQPPVLPPTSTGGGHVPPPWKKHKDDDDDDREFHVHLNMDGRELANAVFPFFVSATGRYGVRNSGKTTGIWKPV